MDLSDLKNKIAIVGVGYTPQGKVPGRTVSSFHVEATRNAIEDAGISKEDVDALFLYRYFAPSSYDYDTTGFTVTEALGITPSVVSQEHQCTRGWLYHAVSLLMTGLAKYVVISFADNSRSSRRAFVNELSNGEATNDLAAFGDLSTVAKYAMQGRRAMELYGSGPEVWKEISIAQRNWALLNPIAGMYGKPLDEAGYYAARKVVDPFRLLDATPTTDGGRAVVLTTAERAKSLKQKPVYIRGIGSNHHMVLASKISVEDGENSAASIASKKAFKMAGITLKDIDALQLYDCFTYTVEATLRDYGFFRLGESKEFLTKERLGPGGELPVNTSGGMLSEAYFMGMTPLSEAVMQLQGRAGDRQLGVLKGTKEPGIIVVSDNGGVFQSHATLVLSSEV